MLSTVLVASSTLCTSMLASRFQRQSLVTHATAAYSGVLSKGKEGHHQLSHVGHRTSYRAAAILWGFPMYPMTGALATGTLMSGRRV
ncbi:hypothetical protein V8C26DRAFT_413550 [Trichoderma gracile]